MRVMNMAAVFSMTTAPAAAITAVAGTTVFMLLTGSVCEIIAVESVSISTVTVIMVFLPLVWIL